LEELQSRLELVRTAALDARIGFLLPSKQGCA
jgi:hypothetical protein